jgi:hypothetical protein
VNRGGRSVISRGRPVSAVVADRDQGAALRFLLELHPAQITVEELIRELTIARSLLRSNRLAGDDGPRGGKIALPSVGDRPPAGRGRGWTVGRPRARSSRR